MTPIIRALIAFAVSLVRSRVSLQSEIVALRHQLTLYQGSSRGPQVHPNDRILWSVIGSIRRECLDHVIVLSEGHLRRLLAGYFHYYHRWRTHLSLAMDCPEARPVQLPDQGTVIEVPEVGGLRYHYERVAA